MSDAQLQYHDQEVEPGVVVISLAGKLLLGAEGEKVVQLVTDLLGRGSRGIIFEIAGLTRIDSTGIGRFIASYNQIEGAGGSMAIAAATPHIRECFRATQLDRVFRFYADVSAAQAAMGPAAGKGA